MFHVKPLKYLMALLLALLSLPAYAIEEYDATVTSFMTLLSVNKTDEPPTFCSAATPGSGNRPIKSRT